MNNELIRLIVELVRRVAKVNVNHSNADVGDIIFLESGRFASRSTCRVQRLLVSSNYHSWVITDRDTVLWDEVVARLCELNKDVSQQWIESELQGLIGLLRKREEKLQYFSLFGV